MTVCQLYNPLILAPKIIDILERLADDDPTVIDDIKRLEGTHVLVLADIERKLAARKKVSHRKK